jgi:hypothetical protein
MAMLDEHLGSVNSVPYLPVRVPMSNLLADMHPSLLQVNALAIASSSLLPPLSATTHPKEKSKTLMCQ